MCAIQKLGNEFYRKFTPAKQKESNAGVITIAIDKKLPDDVNNPPWTDYQQFFWAYFSPSSVSNSYL